MTAPDDTHSAPDELEVEQRGTRLLVSLKRADGWLIGRREVQKSDNCAETADVIAVVVASFRTNAAGKLPEDEAAPPPPPTPPPPPEPASEPSPTTTRALPAPARLTPVRTERHAQPWAFAVSALGVSSPGGPGLGAALELSWLSPHSGLGFCTGVSGQLGQHLAFAAGSAHWERVALSVGARARIASGSWFIDPRAELLASLLEVRGQGFPSDASVVSFDPGFAAGMRSGFDLGAFEPYLGAALAWWPREQTLHVAGAPDSGALPRLEFSLALGTYL